MTSQPDKQPDKAQPSGLSAAPLRRSTAPPALGAHDPMPDLVQRAATIYRSRRLREQHFHSGLFGEPAWDLMLDLFVAMEEKRDISISSACVAACVPATTALRWITMLERRELVMRVGDTTDHRRRFLRLTPQGHHMMLRFLLSDWFVAGA